MAGVDGCAGGSPRGREWLKGLKNESGKATVAAKSRGPVAEERVVRGGGKRRTAVARLAGVGEVGGGVRAATVLLRS